MINLEKLAGVPLEFDEKSFTLNFLEDVVPVKADIRTLEDSRPYLLNQDVKDPKELYYMNRGISRKKDKEIFEKMNLRHDITILRGGTVGREFIKTIGHYHPQIDGLGVSYTEIYEVLYGKVIWLLQKVDFTDVENQIAEEVYWFEAGKGDRIIIPPNFGHITINPGIGPLVMANILNIESPGIYEPIKKAGGGVYFSTPKGWVPNENYKGISPLISKKPNNTESFVLSKEPIYTQFIKDPEKFKFLSYPQDFEAEFAKAL